MSIDRIQPGEWNARAVVHNGTAYLSGIVADDKTLPMKEQTEQVLAKIDGVLASIGTDKTKILSSVVYLADMDKKDDMNEAWMAWIDKKDLPARAAVGVTLTPGTQVEIMVVAAVG
jgi:enamine deaminase RidA (YjgF/YER057c/UK114 family)